MGGMPAELMALQGVLESASERVLVTDRNGCILYVNAAFEKITGFRRSEVIGLTPRILKSGKHSARFYEQFWAILLDGQSFRSRFLNKKKDGTLYFEDQLISPVKDRQGNITHFISIANDVSEKLALQKTLRVVEEEMQHVATLQREVDGLLSELGRPSKYGAEPQ